MRRVALRSHSWFSVFCAYAVVAIVIAAFLMVRRDT
jgi:hypothetical protein